MNFEKGFNYLKYKLLCNKQNRISYVPPIFVATITNKCNLKCPTCLYRLQNDGKFFGDDFISEKTFRDMLWYNDTAKARTIYFTGGEPLLHPNLDKLLNISEVFKLEKKMSTNGLLLKKKINILNRFDEINVSLDGYDYKSFAVNRGSTKEVYDEIVKSLWWSRPAINKLSISFLLSQDNVDKAYRMIEFAQERFSPDSVIFHNYNPHSFDNSKTMTVDDNKSCANLFSLLKYRPDFDVVVSNVFDEKSKYFKNAFCKLPWFYFCFDSNRKVAPCCHLEHSIETKYECDCYNEFNTREMINLRSKKIVGSYNHKDCRYCQRRFLGNNFMEYNAKTKQWKVN